MFAQDFKKSLKLLKLAIARGKNYLQHLKTLYIHETAQINTSPIFILGHQKSGTTAIAALLAKISSQAVTIDLFHQIDLKGHLREQLFREDLAFEQIVKNNKFYFSTPLNKDPNFTFLYEKLYQDFPQAQFIMVIRDPRDTIRSFLNWLQLPGNLEILPQNYWQMLAQKAAQGPTLVLQGHLPEVAGNSYMEILAQRWNLAAETYLTHKANFVLIRYEDFVADKVGAISKLAEQVDLKVTDDISQAINIQYQPKGKHDVSWEEFFGNANLGKIGAICAEKMSYFDYQ
ncbi:MAG: sulfotransferase [Okeania sp. SIO2D1]|nr:sulfotransferase [Okeania sp. SIO2D1]